MQYAIHYAGDAPDLSPFHRALAAADAAALADFDAARKLLRVSTWLDGNELLALLHAAGCAVTPAQLELLPSECCGGCGG